MTDTVEDLLGHLERRMADVDELEAPAREAVYQLLDGIDALHRRALTSLVEAVDGGEIDRARRADPAVDWLLAAYGAGTDQRDAAEEALEEIRPYIHSHGGEVEVLGVEGGVVHLKLRGTCAGCSASAVTLEHGIEEALEEHFPGFVGLEVEEEEADPHGPPGPTLVELDTSRLSGEQAGADR